MNREDNHLRMKAIGLLVLISITAAGGQYHGENVGPFRERNHQVRGEAYIEDEEYIRIVNFNYDGNGPDAFFHVATDENKRQLTKIPDENGDIDKKLSRYNEDTIRLKLPSDIQMKDVKYLLVYCIMFSENFGDVQFPQGLIIPTDVNIGQFAQYAHQVQSGDVFLMNTNKMLIKNFHYDGNGPNAFFFAVDDNSFQHSRSLETPQNGGYPKLPSTEREKQNVRYSGEDVTLILADEYSFSDFKLVSLYCVPFSQNFGEVLINIPSNKRLKPQVKAGSDGSTDLDNCEKLQDNFNVGWSIVGNDIILELISNSGFEYMGFGLSGDDSKSSMLKADVVIVRMEGNTPLANDYFLENYAQCSAGTGACPDDLSGFPLNVEVISGSKKNGLVKIRVKRALDTGDTSGDRPFIPANEQYIVWAIGDLNPETYVLKHNFENRLSDNKKIHFGRTPEKNCKDLVAPDVKDNVKWKEMTLYGGKDRTNFNVRMGQTGGDRGYKAITGSDSWGIAFYIDGILIPRLVLERGYNYTFEIETGNDVDNTAEYHPFYITDDPVGGYIQQTSEEQQASNYFAGILANGQPDPPGIGRFCEYRVKADVLGNPLLTSDTFDQYRANLELNCEEGPRGIIHFSPDDNTPEVLFYQCYTHRRLGWKIVMAGASLPSFSHITLTLLFTITIMVNYLNV